MEIWLYSFAVLFPAVAVISCFLYIVTPFKKHK